MKLSLKVCTLLSFFSIFLCLTFYVSTSYAEEMLFVSPTRITLSDKNNVGVMNVTNMSNSVRHYTISLENIIMTEQGVTTEVENFEFSAKRMVRFVPREVRLEPGERQAVRIMARVGADMPDGDYHAHIHFLEDATKRERVKDDSGKVSIQAPLSYSTLIPIVVSHGEVKVSLEMQDVKVSKSEDGKKYFVSMKLNRSGNGQGTAYFDTILTGGGKESVPTPRRTAYIYREIDSRHYQYEFPVSEATQGYSKIKIRLFDVPDKQATPLKEVELSLP